MKPVYFDQASTTAVNPSVLETYQKVLQEYYYNSESLYPQGAAVSAMMEQSRQQTALLLNVQPNELIFTSGGSEANNLALKGTVLARGRKHPHIISSLIEHSSVVNSCQWLKDYAGCEVTWLPVMANGKIDADKLEAAIRPETVLVAVMMVNNESGAIQPLAKVKQILHRYPDIRLHVDCVQALGKIPLDLQQISSASFSAHKIHGLKGSGLLYHKANLPIVPLISGGQQEYGLRGGTADAPADIMWGKTIRLALQDIEAKTQTISHYHDKIYAALQKMDHVVINSPADGSKAIVNFSCVSIKSQVMLNALAQAGYLVSAQSTCDSRDAVSRVIAQMYPLDKQRQGSTVRISIDCGHTEDQIDGLIDAIEGIIKKYG